MVGLDVVDVDRFRVVLKRSPSLTERFFTEEERSYCSHKTDPAIHFAGTFAAKEAVMKVLGLTPAPAWARRIEVSRDADGAPIARVGGREVSVSISHDGGYAVAIALR